MKKFTVNPIDLDVELTLIDGEVVNLTSDIRITKDVIEVGKEIERITKDFTAIENPTLEQAVDYTTTFLSLIYKKEPVWFAENVSQEAMNQMLVYIQGELTGRRVPEQK